MQSLYKKRSLQFSGFSKEIKVNELMHERANSRHQRLSVLRSITEEIKENESKIPKFGKRNNVLTGIPSRADMLKKWKEEKLLKQEREQQMKKPAFKVGVIPKFNIPTLPLLEKASNKSFGSKSRLSNVSKASCDTDTKSRISSKMPVPSKAVSDTKMRNKAPQTLKPTTFTQKTSQISKLESGCQNSSSVKSASSQLKSTQTTKLASFKPIQKVSIPTSRTNTHTKKATSSSSQDTASNISKPVSSSLRSSQASKTSVPFKASQKPLSFKPAFNKGAKCKETITAPKSNVQKTSISKESLSDEPSKQIFDCNISHIEPVSRIRKSFAPENFLFRPPVELNFSCFNIDGPSAIFSREKTEIRERTSTPLKGMDQSSKSETNSKIDSLKETDLNLKLSPYKEVDQELKSIQVKDTDKSLKSTSEKEVAQNLESIPLKETDKSLTSIPFEKTETDLIPLQINKTDTNLTSIQLEDKNPNSIRSSVEEIYKSNYVNDTVEKQRTFSDVENRNELNISTELLTEKEEILESINNNNSEDNNVYSAAINSLQNGILENKQKLSLDDSIDFDKFLAEHGDESLDTFSNVPEDSLKDFKVSDLNLPEARQSRKPSNGASTKSKQSVKPNLESIRESLESKQNLGATPKTSSKKATKDNSSFTPRRSVRLAEKLRRSGSFESILNMQRPSIMGSLDLDEPIFSTASSGITYDFESLHLEDTPKLKKGHKVSLLFTPPTRRRPSTRKSIKGDLISFSPFS